MDFGQLHLGKNEKDEIVKIPAGVLRRHVAVLGASGSGKTVLGKTVIEEATINGIPSIIVDPQGDLASLAILESVKELKGKGFDKERRDVFKKKAEVRVFTPASSKGIPISVNPLKFPEKTFSEEEMVRALDLTSTGLTQLIGYSLGTDSGKACQNFLYTLLKHCWASGLAVKDFAEFSQLARDPGNVGFSDPGQLLNARLQANIATKLNYLSIGMEKLLFNFGTKVDMDNFMRPVDKGSIPINVLYLNTLTSSEHKQFFVAMLAKEIYTWMLQNPSDSVQLVFYIDEVGPYLPPHPHNPPSKEMISYLFKQGRKYGVSCFMCTQNPADVDYKAMSQANTLAFGRMITKQDLDKIKHILKSSSPDSAASILGALPSLSAGNFVLVCPDVYREPQRFKGRWLYTKHLTLDEEHIRSHVQNRVVEAFKRHEILPGKRVYPPSFPDIPHVASPPSPTFLAPSDLSSQPFPPAQPPLPPAQIREEISFHEPSPPVSRKETKRQAKEGKKTKKPRKQRKKGKEDRKTPKESEEEFDGEEQIPTQPVHHVKFTMGRRKGEELGMEEEKKEGLGPPLSRLKTIIPVKVHKEKDSFSHDLTETSLISEMNVKLSMATKMARKVMKTRHYTGKKNLGGGKLVLVPLWSVRFMRTVRKRLWFFPLIKVKREEERGLFFSAENGGLLQMAEHISFSNTAHEDSKHLKDFDELAQFRESSNLSLPASLPTPKITPETVVKTAHERFQVTPRYMKFALLPAWEFEVRSEEGALEEQIFIDATFGKVVER